MNYRYFDKYEMDILNELYVQGRSMTVWELHKKTLRSPTIIKNRLFKLEKLDLVIPIQTNKKDRTGKYRIEWILNIDTVEKYFRIAKEKRKKY